MELDETNKSILADIGLFVLAYSQLNHFLKAHLLPEILPLNINEEYLNSGWVLRKDVNNLFPALFSRADLADTIKTLDSLIGLLYSDSRPFRRLSNILKKISKLVEKRNILFHSDIMLSHEHGVVGMKTKRGKTGFSINRKEVQQCTKDIREYELEVSKFIEDFRRMKEKGYE